ncbi:MAG TPA: hypothetical protein VGJ21_03445 [Terracidiphilus sp.]|jgi:hypothetical protein
MVVRTLRKGRDNFGLRVSAANARRYFSPASGPIELRLGDLQIQCDLPDSFWTGQPEINDPRLCEWLKFKVLKERRDENPVMLHMVQSGSNTFTLHPKSLLERRAVRLNSAA